MRFQAESITGCKGRAPPFPQFLPWFCWVSQPEMGMDQTMNLIITWTGASFIVHLPSLCICSFWQPPWFFFQKPAWSTILVPEPNMLSWRIARETGTAFPSLPEVHAVVVQSAYQPSEQRASTYSSVASCGSSSALYDPPRPSPSNRESPWRSVVWKPHEQWTSVDLHFFGPCPSLLRTIGCQTSFQCDS